MAALPKSANPRATILRRKQVEARTGLSKSTIYAKTKLNPDRPGDFDASFPKPIPLGAKSVGWLEHEIDAWIETRIQQRADAA